ncbi:hypothetical protein TREMEDRAFT_41061 [Tremella mesenterica DSM 1558]|uniref:uncharacterized protein n=1 Tax=Tremella mesenterica (strain ATCC 24925 / CBS 8224 / DSM 1558 / NBRC 9311 / NRRL Y-6157 / RJB 2259-6 / UBC 559-6) TaxID=578456 RepID=UPI00032C3DB6|nr:uncharacterized protein TREMEDRAFT_41061 [Tremella mesenterica DSM 1558]EIW66238.1 hypothetical protein TREMEDRAFT_41061 [Tremella mesenterica DSM 1558]
MASSAFNLLTAGGARFDKRRFNDDIRLFTQPSSKSSKRQRTQALPSDQLPTSLDVFHDHTHPSNRPPASSSSEDELPRPPKQKITITGSDPLPKSLHTNMPSLFNHPPSPLTSAQGQPLLTALKAAGIHSLWGVQCAVAGSLLEGHDTLCIAPTGSGKTLAYLLPTLVRLQDPVRTLTAEDKGQGVRAIVLVPTHDLAVQIHGVLKVMCKGRKWRCLVLSKATEMAKTRRAGLGIDILVATPERLHHLINEQRVSLAETSHIILDEADRLLSPDFLPQVEPIVEACTHPKVQKCLLSATIPAGAEALARTWLREGGVRIVVGIKDSAVTTVDQSLVFTATESGKLMTLRQLISSGDLPYPSLIFVQSIERAEELCKTLALEGVKVDMVHGGRSRTKREEAVVRFRKGDVWILVVTEVLARGMDFRGVKVVINYDFPQTVQSYIHRVGRTGRAGRPGKAITFFSHEDGPYLRTIANVLRSSGCPVPQYMLDLPAPSKNQKRHLAKVPVKRKSVGGGGRDVGKEKSQKKREMKEASKRKRDHHVESES